MKMTFSPEGRDFSQTVVCHVSEDFLSSSTFGNLSCDVKSDPSTNVCGKWAGKLSDEVPNNNMSRKVIGKIPCKPANQIKVTENILGEVFASVST